MKIKKLFSQVTIFSFRKLFEKNIDTKLCLLSLFENPNI